jgi:general secretion pathway protein J
MTDRAPRIEEDGEAGFTLVEMLVALALFSVLVTVLFGNVQFGLKAWNKTSASTGQLDRALIVQDVLRRLVGGLYPLALSENGAQPLVDFSGGRDVMSFLGNAPLVMGGAGRFRYELAVERSDRQSNLVLNAMPELANDRSASAKTLLLSDIVRVEFSYLGVGKGNQADTWVDSWTRRADTPRLVRIRVAFHSDNARAWPELLIAPRVLADVACVYDSITMRCRGR